MSIVSQAPSIARGVSTPRTLALVLVCVAAPLGACANGGDDPSLAPPSHDAQDSSLTSDATDSSIGFHPDALPETSSDGGTLGGCSEDLHSLLDAEGKVIFTCPPDQGCKEGACVPACDAAANVMGSTGCDFWTFNPPWEFSTKGSCFAAFVTNTWSAPVSVDVTFRGSKVDPTASVRLPHGSGPTLKYDPLPADGKIPAGDSAIVFLAHSGTPAIGKPGTGGQNVGCPDGVTPIYTSDDLLDDSSGSVDGFEITTSAPISAYSIYPYGGGYTAVTGATLLIPTPTWGTNYVGFEVYPDTAGGAYGDWYAIVAQEDDTHVSLRPGASLTSGSGTYPAGTPASFTLKKGQVLELAEAGSTTPGGVPIDADKPFGVFVGTKCANQPATWFACDGDHEELFPVKANGSEYVGVSHRDRYDGVKERVPYNLIGLADGTTLTYVPSKPMGAPDSLDANQYVAFESDVQFVVKSQDGKHPFTMTTAMTGADFACRGNADGCPAGDESKCVPPVSCADRRGDPEMTMMVAAAQYLRNYTIVTDPTYSETELVIVRAKEAGAFADVELDCAGTLGGWTDLGDYQWTRVDLVTGNFKAVGACDNGRHELHSNGHFGLTVWAWGSSATGAFGSAFFTQNVSYAYPGGASVKLINDVVVPSKIK